MNYQVDVSFQMLTLRSFFMYRRWLIDHSTSHVECTLLMSWTRVRVFPILFHVLNVAKLLRFLTVRRLGLRCSRWHERSPSRLLANNRLPRTAKSTCAALFLSVCWRVLLPHFEWLEKAQATATVGGMSSVADAATRSSCGDETLLFLCFLIDRLVEPCESTPVVCLGAART